MDVKNGYLNSRVNDEEVSFNIGKALRRHDDFQVNVIIDMVDGVV